MAGKRKASPKIDLLVGERHEDETDREVMACNDYLRLGAGRTVMALLRFYEDKVNFFSSEKPPTVSRSSLMKWSAKYGWKERGALYDAEWEQRKNKELSEARNAGLALESERIRKLNRLASFLEAQIYQRNEFTGAYDNIWVADVKQIGKGEEAERVDIVRFNPALLEQYRGVLSDLAAETGGRVKRLEGDFDGIINVIFPDELTDGD